MSDLTLALRRDWLLARRRSTDAVLPLGFFIAAAALFPIAVGSEFELLRPIGAGIVWACALLASVATASHAFSADWADGSIDQMLIGRVPLPLLVLSKALVHWLSTGAPLVLAAPLLGLMFGLGGEAIAVLTLSLALGTPTLALLGLLGAALTLGVRAAAGLVVLLVLPLAVPVLVFGTLAVGAVTSGLSAVPHLSLLAAVLLLAVCALPWVIAATLRISSA